MSVDVNRSPRYHNGRILHFVKWRMRDVHVLICSTGDENGM